MVAGAHRAAERARPNREAYAASLFAFSAFLVAPLAAPGPIELANLAGVALAIWVAVVVRRNYGRDDIPDTFAYRVSTAGPGLLISATVLFTITLAVGWVGWMGYTSDQVRLIDDGLSVLWDFAYSPVALFATTGAPGLPPSADALRLMTTALSAAVLLGVVFALMNFVGAVRRRRTLRRHAVIWRGWPIDNAEIRLAARGVRGLAPVRDPLEEATARPLAKWAFLRAASLIVAIVGLPFAPTLMQLISALPNAEVQAIFASPLMNNPFFAIWITGLWAFCIAGAINLFGAYLRLGFVLAAK